MNSLLSFTSVPPLALYVHVPWCVRKCPYCDFNSHALVDGIPEEAYIEALLADLDQELPVVWGRPLTSIFIGGGTPSLLSPAAVDRLLSAVRARFPNRAPIEVTLEANPGTLEQGRFSEFRAAGVNRLSVGVQSFADHHLTALGRIHSGAEARRAIEAARAAGFERLNIDLMFGLPQQTLAEALADIATAAALGPDHLSWYQLTIEPNTAFGHAPPPLPEEETLWAIFSEGQARLAALGYNQYEVSAYARAGAQCLHNLNYWTFGDYLGIGAGAHGKVTEPAYGRITRRWKVRHPRDYLAGAHGPGRVGGEEALGRRVLPLEFLMNALRLTDGFETRLFEERCGLPVAVVAERLTAAERDGFITWDARRIVPTERGRLHLDTLLERFVEI